MAGCLAGPAPTQTSAPQPTTPAAVLVDALPQPADVADCGSLAATAGDFVRAAAAVAATEQGDPAAAEGLRARLIELGDGYAERDGPLGCDEAETLTQVPLPARPGEGATVTEVIEYVLSGGDLSYPLDDQPATLDGGAP